MWYTAGMKRKLSGLIALLLLLAALCGVPLGCAPDDGPTGDASVELLPVQEQSPAPLPLPTATPDPLLAIGGAYTIGWLSDTQHYSRLYPVIFHEQTRFLKDNAERLNLVYIVHTGDLVHNRDTLSQWEVADEAMQTIDDIPYGVCAGNHDVGTQLKDCDYTIYSRYFGEARMAGKPWYGGSYQDNRGHFDLIDAGNTRYLFVYMGYHIDEDSIAWMNRVFADHRDRVGVLCVHSYFNHDCTLTDQGVLLYERVVAANPNLYMVLCGHRYNSNCIPATFDDNGDGVPERTVLQMICNYQAAGTTGGEGYLRLMQVDEAAGEIRFLNYSPLRDDFVYYDTPEHQAESYSFDPAGEQGSAPIPWL